VDVGDVGAPAQQGPALALGEAAPHAELDAMVEGVGEALGAHRAAQAHGLGAVLGRALDEEAVGVRPAAGRVDGPIVDPHHGTERMEWGVTGNRPIRPMII